MRLAETVDEKQVERPLAEVGVQELWREIGRRYGVRFGKIQMAYHDTEPSEVVTVTHRRRKATAGA